MSRPIRHGKPWSTNEIQRLLQEIKKKQTHEEIATTHQRSVGSIRSRLQELAADYYFNDNRPIDEIMQFTGLSKQNVLDAIAKRTLSISMKEEKEECIIEQKVIESSTATPKYEPKKKKESRNAILLEIRDMLREMLVIMKQQTSNN